MAAVDMIAKATGRSREELYRMQFREYVATKYDKRAWWLTDEELDRCVKFKIVPKKSGSESAPGKKF